MLYESIHILWYIYYVEEEYTIEYILLYTIYTLGYTILEYGCTIGFTIWCALIIYSMDNMAVGIYNRIYNIEMVYTAGYSV